MTFFKKKEPAKPQFEQNNVNTALQAAITPIGLEFKRNEFLLGENYCRIYGIIGYPAEVDYGWYAKLTNIPGTIVTINSQPLDNGAMLPTMAKNINTARGIELSTKDAIERQRAKKTADDQEKMIQDMDQRNESLGSFSTLIMVLSQNEQDFRDRCTRVVSLANSMGCRIRAIPNLQKRSLSAPLPDLPA